MFLKHSSSFSSGCGKYCIYKHCGKSCATTHPMHMLSIYDYKRVWIYSQIIILLTRAVMFQTVSCFLFSEKTSRCRWVPLSYPPDMPCHMKIIAPSCDSSRLTFGHSLLHIVLMNQPHIKRKKKHFTMWFKLHTYYFLPLILVK